MNMACEVFRWCPKKLFFSIYLVNLARHVRGEVQKKRKCSLESIAQTSVEHQMCAWLLSNPTQRHAVSQWQDNVLSHTLLKAW